jgi:hypothetical protein
MPIEIKSKLRWTDWIRKRKLTPTLSDQIRFGRQTILILVFFIVMILSVPDVETDLALLKFVYIATFTQAVLHTE